MGDSFYEYLLKLWLLTGKKHDQYKRMYLESTRAMLRWVPLIADDCPSLPLMTSQLPLIATHCHSLPLMASPHCHSLPLIATHDLSRLLVSDSQLTYVAESTNGQLQHKMDHLVSHTTDGL